MVCTCEYRGTCTACRLAEALNAGQRLTSRDVIDAHRAKRRTELLNTGRWVRAGNMEVRLS